MPAWLHASFFADFYTPSREYQCLSPVERTTNLHRSYTFSDRCIMDMKDLNATCATPGLKKVIPRLIPETFQTEAGEMMKISRWRLAGFESVGWNLFLLCAGSMVTAIGINGILIPHRCQRWGPLSHSFSLSRAVPLCSTDLRRRQYTAFSVRLVFHQPKVLSV